MTRRILRCVGRRDERVILFEELREHRRRHRPVEAREGAGLEQIGRLVVHGRDGIQAAPHVADYRTRRDSDHDRRVPVRRQPQQRAKPLVRQVDADEQQGDEDDQW